jgi:Arc/MetJ-type ribon-helix-helix transcriptional regulator
MVELFWDPLAELDADPIVAFGHRGADTMRSWIGDEYSGTSIVRLIAESSSGRPSTRCSAPTTASFTPRCSTFRGTILVMPRTVQARLDEHAEEDLALLRNEGHNDSDAIRLALREAAERRRRKSAVRLEVEAAASDPEDLSEAREVRAEMDALAAPWPES